MEWIILVKDRTQSSTNSEPSYGEAILDVLDAAHSVVHDPTNTDYGLFKHDTPIRVRYEDEDVDSAWSKYAASILRLPLQPFYELTRRRLFACGQCDHSAPSEAGLRTHVETAHGSPPAKQSSKFGCDKCNYETSRRYQLITHEKTHTGEKNFACEHCSYRTGDRSNLRKHRSIHERKLVVNGHARSQSAGSNVTRQRRRPCRSDESLSNSSNSSDQLNQDDTSHSRLP